MSANDVQNEILGPMQRLFYAPRKMEPEDEQAALRDYVSALQNFPAADLATAWAFVRDSHPKTSWPVPSTFVLAAHRARKERQAAQGGATGKPASQNERWDRWVAISRSPLACEAVKRGVSWALKCAVLHDGKTAEQIDLRALVSGKASAERTAAAIEAGRGVEVKGRTVQFKPNDAATALRMWDAIKLREAETQDEIRRVAA